MHYNLLSEIGKFPLERYISRGNDFDLAAKKLLLKCKLALLLQTKAIMEHRLQLSYFRYPGNKTHAVFFLGRLKQLVGAD